VKKYKSIEDYTEKFDMDSDKSRVQAFFYIDRDSSGEITDVRFSHCRFQTGVEPNGYVLHGPALGNKELGSAFGNNLVGRVNQMIDEGDFE
tara:strand:+ start:292 stop:564 length:273 start_codon:yes stop_codon:yes gene_type:complete